jgi:hypothetical protein
MAAPRGASTGSRLMEDLARWFERHDVHLPMLLVTIGLLILAAVVILVLNRLLRGLIRRLELRYHLPYETVLTASRIANGGLWILAALLILNIWGSASVGYGRFWSARPPSSESASWRSGP